MAMLMLLHDDDNDDDDDEEEEEEDDDDDDYHVKMSVIPTSCYETSMRKQWAGHSSKSSLRLKRNGTIRPESWLMQNTFSPDLTLKNSQCLQYLLNATTVSSIKMLRVQL